MGVFKDIKRIAAALEEISMTEKLRLAVEREPGRHDAIVSAILTLNKPRGRKARNAITAPLDVAEAVAACAKWSIEDPMDTEIMRKMAELAEDGDSGPLFAEEEESHA